MRRNKPTFLGIGVQKSGTIWLHNQLKKSDMVWLPRVKELHFFDRADKYPSPSHLTTEKLIDRSSNPALRRKIIRNLKNLFKAVYRLDYERARWILKMNLGNYNYKWYQSLFRLKGNIKASGEIAPSYHIVDNYEIEQMYNLNPDLRLIFLIRNPIDRDWSALRFKATKGVEEINFENYEQVTSILNSPEFLEHSNYLKAIKNFTTVFNNEQLLICFYDAISCDPYGLLKDIYIHIGLDETEIDQDEMKKVHNPSLEKVIPEAIHSFLKARHENQINELAKLLGSYASIWEGNEVERARLYPTTKVYGSIL